MKKKLFTFRVLGLLMIILMLGTMHASADGLVDCLADNPFSLHYEKSGKKVINALKLVDHDREELLDVIGNRIYAVEWEMTSNELRFYVTQPCILHITGGEALLDKNGEPRVISDTDDVMMKKINISKLEIYMCNVTVLYDKTVFCFYTKNESQGKLLWHI